MFELRQRDGSWASSPLFKEDAPSMDDQHAESHAGDIKDSLGYYKAHWK